MVTCDRCLTGRHPICRRGDCACTICAATRRPTKTERLRTYRATPAGRASRTAEQHRYRAKKVVVEPLRPRYIFPEYVAPTIPPTTFDRYNELRHSADLRLAAILEATGASHAESRRHVNHERKIA